MRLTPVLARELPPFPPRVISERKSKFRPFEMELGSLSNHSGPTYQRIDADNDMVIR
jgi:hypothetical protein